MRFVCYLGTCTEVRRTVEVRGFRVEHRPEAGRREDLLEGLLANLDSRIA